MAIVNYENKTFILSGKLSIYKVSEMRKLFIEYYNSEPEKKVDFYLDISNADSIDASVLQLLISLNKTIKLGNGKLFISKS